MNDEYSDALVVFGITGDLAFKKILPALEKLASFGVKIGYPSKWRDYSALQVKDGDLFGNWERVAAFDWAYEVSRIGGPVDNDEWGMTPQTVNAYYSPVKNEIVFPAAILQPPYFDPEADPAVNYGAIGGVDPRPSVTNPGYVSPPSGTVTTYYYSARDAFRTATGVQTLSLESTALLIVVGVGLDTMRQLEAQLLMRHYRGFIK